MAEQPAARNGEIFRQIADQFPATVPGDDFQSEFTFAVKLDFRDWRRVLVALQATAAVSERLPSEVGDFMRELERELAEARDEIAQAANMLHDGLGTGGNGSETLRSIVQRAIQKHGAVSATQPNAARDAEESALAAWSRDVQVTIRGIGVDPGRVGGDFTGYTCNCGQVRVSTDGPCERSNCPIPPVVQSATGRGTDG